VSGSKAAKQINKGRRKNGERGTRTREQIRKKIQRIKIEGIKSRIIIFKVG
jgi:hypothetical protein